MGFNHSFVEAASQEEGQCKICNGKKAEHRRAFLERLQNGENINRLREERKTRVDHPLIYNNFVEERKSFGDSSSLSDPSGRPFIREPSLRLNRN